MDYSTLTSQKADLEQQLSEVNELLYGTNASEVADIDEVKIVKVLEQHKSNLIAQG